MIRKINLLVLVLLVIFLLIVNHFFHGQDRFPRTGRLVVDADSVPPTAQRAVCCHGLRFRAAAGRATGGTKIVRLLLVVVAKSKKPPNPLKDPPGDDDRRASFLGLHGVVIVVVGQACCCRRRRPGLITLTREKGMGCSKQPGRRKTLLPSLPPETR
jgi:hypothetical protein